MKINLVSMIVPLTLVAILPFSPTKMISEANVSQRISIIIIIALLYSKTDFKLLHNSTVAILVGM